jgi:hypothetical protein
MKRPRSFMVAKTLLALAVALFVAMVIEAGSGLDSGPAHAGVLTSRVMNPRAGDPDGPPTVSPDDLYARDEFSRGEQVDDPAVTRCSWISGPLALWQQVSQLIRPSWRFGKR